MTPRRTSPLVALALVLGACGDPPATPTPPADAGGDVAAPDVTIDRAPADVSAPDAADAAATDAVDVADAAQDVAPDAAVDVAVDVAADAPGDAGARDGSEAILGTLRGACGTVRAMLRSPSPSLLRNALTFTAPERYERAALSPGGQRLFDTENAGGSSAESEVMSFEVLHHCEGASLLRTETEIRYAPPDDSGPNSITDILVEIGGERVGVSVTRAYRPAPMTLTDAAVRDLLAGKLQGVNRSSVRVLPADRWVKQILHVFAASDEGAAQVERVWGTLDATLRADTIVVVTATRGGGFIYCNPDPPLGAECPPLM